MNSPKEKFSLKKSLLLTPGILLNNQTIPLIEAWDDSPKAIQLLEVLDLCCINISFMYKEVFELIEEVYKITLMNEGISHNNLIQLASWRTNLNNIKTNKFYDPHKGWVTFTYTEAYIKQKGQ